MSGRNRFDDIGRRAPFGTAARLVLLVGILVSLTSIAGVATEAVDDRGVTVQLGKEPERLVVLGAFYAQMLVDLDLASRIIAIGESPDNPPELAGAPDVGPVYAPSVERILALAPDLVLGATDWNGDRAALEGAGIATYSAPWLTGIQSIYDAVRRVGSLLGVAAEAEDLLTSVQSSIEAQQARVSGERRLVAYVYAQPGGTVYAMGTATPEDDLIALAGLVNAFRDLQGYAQVSVESLVSLDPVYVITDPTQIEILEEDATLSTLGAVAGGRVVGIPARLLGSTRIGEALRMLVDAVYGT